MNTWLLVENPAETNFKTWKLRPISFPETVERGFSTKARYRESIG
jgi:hypothetical protein